MGNRKILLIIAGSLIVVGVAICFIVGIGESFKCDCAKNDDCKNINKPVEENDVYEATVIDMGLDLAHSVTFDYNVIEALDTNLGALDLAIAGKYLLIFDNEFIWLDDFNGYAIYHNDIVGLDDKTVKLLKQVLEFRDDNGDCCSCCPDLKPGESCIALCCPCGR